MTTSLYILQTIVQTARFSKIILNFLQYNVAEHQKDGDIFVLPLAYAYITQAYRSSMQALFRLVRSQNSPEPTLLESGIALPTDSHAKKTLYVWRSGMEARIRSLRAKVDANMATALQGDMQDYA